jgi:hypothetical protein
LVFPRSKFTRAKLIKSGIGPRDVEEFESKVDALPNLQLLPGGPNIEKQATLPAEWLRGPHFKSDPARRAQYVLDNDLQLLPEDLAGSSRSTRIDVKSSKTASGLRWESRLKRAANPVGGIATRRVPAALCAPLMHPRLRRTSQLKNK